jgi:hypothetical protein
MGGEDRAFHMPLSEAMLECLDRARELGAQMHPRHAREWIFPADSPDGHLVEHKERRVPKARGGTRGVLFKWGGDLRQSYRTVAQEVGVGEVHVHLLLNHRMPGVSAGYITRGALLDHLREQQKRISRKILQKLGAKR